MAQRLEQVVKTVGMDVVPESTAEWTLFYHGGSSYGKEMNFKGRAEPMRLMFEEAGVAYTESGENLYGPTGLCDAFRGGTDSQGRSSVEAVKADTAPFPVMFPPMISHQPKIGEAVFVNNTHPILRYMASQLGYLPSTPADTARADQIVANVVDFIAEGRLTFHPTDGVASYASQKAAADICSKLWSEGRLRVWLQHFEKVLRRAAGAGPVVGSSLTYADFALFFGLEAVEAQFNTDFYNHVFDNEDIPYSKAYALMMQKRPGIAAYKLSTRCRPWAGDSMM